MLAVQKKNTEIALNSKKNASNSKINAVNSKNGYLEIHSIRYTIQC